MSNPVIDSVCVAAVQMCATPDLGRNLEAAARLVAQAAAQGARLVVLPEYFCLMGRSDRDKLAIAEDDGDGPIQDALSRWARDHALTLVGGTLPIRSTVAPEARVRNASCVYGPQGQRLARYDKIHLFRFQTDTESYDEGRVLEAGDTPTHVDMPLGDRSLRVGLSICYDLRFPELYRALSPPASPCDLIVVPSAFTQTTGQAHWDLLLRARAVENQCAVIASAQGGLHENGRRTYGHSLVVDAWGRVLAERHDDGEGVVLATVDLAAMRQIRSRLPALTHRRQG